MLVKEFACAKPVLYSQFSLDLLMENLEQSFDLNFFVGLIPEGIGTIFTLI
uniref:Uncharacterized protein n=1 Tax=Rhizophagus irregularis (strain DAOM 181602 / DAOM 197198 / MUCL 43194) TaxID=747089 RepID=U9UV09_RHIID